MAAGVPSLLVYYYGNLPEAGVDGADDATVPRSWYTFDHRPRFGTNYTGLDTRINLSRDTVNIDEFKILDNRGFPMTIGGTLAVHERAVGAVNIRKTRHALPAGLIADAVAVLLAVYVVRWMLG